MVLFMITEIEKLLLTMDSSEFRLTVMRKNYKEFGLNLTREIIKRQQLTLTTRKNNTLTRSPATNSRFAKAGVSCFYDSEVLNSIFVHLMKFSAENSRLRKAAKR